MLKVEQLRVTLQTPHGPADAVRGVSFSMARGDTLGLVGESGCGKSLTAMALMGLLPDSARVGGSIQFTTTEHGTEHNTELVGSSDAELRHLRGNRIAMVFQEPMTALNPLHTIGHQVAEPLRLHKNLSHSDARAQALRLLDRVGIPDAARRMDAYPHQFSGGQRQRITIAMALACGPDLLIADEPTTALDVTVAGEVLKLIRELVKERGMGMILISHDLGVIAQNADRMLVMYGGTVVESGPTREVFAQRAHPYTRGLFASRPSFGATTVTDAIEGSLQDLPRKRPRLPSIPGTVPELHLMPSGCPFASRCDVALPSCATQTPPTVTLGPQHASRCVLLQTAKTPPDTHP
jgi:peptide/nickel transport system ATP-binding protein